VRKADNISPSCAVVTKSVDLNFLEPFGPVQVCNGVDLSLFRLKTVVKFVGDEILVFCGLQILVDRRMKLHNSSSLC